MIEVRQNTLEGKSCKALLLLANRIDTLAVTGARIALILSFSLIAIAGNALYPLGLHVVPLYMIPVCLATWRLGMRAGLLSVLVAAILATSICLVSKGTVDWVTLSNLALQLVTLPVLVAIVSSFRCSYDREHFLARSDGATGALNRLAFEHKAKRVIASAADRNLSAVVMYLDLDEFKLINDRYGHDAGDRVLEAFGDAGRRVIRANDCFGRMGGDEFAIIMPLGEGEVADTVAHRVHAQLTAALADSGYPATCSMGVLVVNPDRQTSLKDVMRCVDQLMYTVKHSGKNGFRLSVFDSSSGPEDLPLFANVEITHDWYRPPQPIAVESALQSFAGGRL